MRCSRRRRRCFKYKLLYFRSTDASHPTPHHPSPTGAVSLRLGHTRGKTTLSCFLRPSCRFATSRGRLFYAILPTIECYKRFSSVGECLGAPEYNKKDFRQNENLPKLFIFHYSSAKRLHYSLKSTIGSSRRRPLQNLCEHCALKRRTN